MDNLSKWYVSKMEYIDLYDFFFFVWDGVLMDSFFFFFFWMSDLIYLLLLEHLIFDWTQK